MSGAPSDAEQILDAAAHALRDRGTQRDRPDGERSMGRAVAAFNRITGHLLTETDGWDFMELLKIVRSRGGAYRADDFVDRAGYAALAGEAAKPRSLTSRFECEVVLGGAEAPTPGGGRYACEELPPPGKEIPGRVVIGDTAPMCRAAAIDPAVQAIVAVAASAARDHARDWNERHPWPWVVQTDDSRPPGQRRGRTHGPARVRNDVAEVLVLFQAPPESHYLPLTQLTPDPGPAPAMPPAEAPADTDQAAP